MIGGKIMTYTIAKAAKKTGISAHTLRFYDKEGLLPFVKRDANGNREFTEEDFEWLSVSHFLYHRPPTGIVDVFPTNWAAHSLVQPH
jgi:hypothetical protein